ncbi:MAG: GNAT family N-acetyltransferase [Acetobacteraceae bacterium]|nr:GNAT family N-acetyltransferase [Acetobacteraceae bacterium]
MIEVRPAAERDAAGMGAVHVGVWRSAYAGILPDAYLAGLSAVRQAAYYHTGIVRGHAALIAEANGRVVGFATMGLTRDALGQSEIETLYVADDWREQGTGRRLMQRAGQDLAARGAASAFLWVLSDNPSRWFYQRLGGRRAAEGHTRVAGIVIPKTAYVWDPIQLLLPPR